MSRLPKFEEAIGELEQIVEKVETGQVGLEDSLVEYERGMKLIKQCREILDAAQQRIDNLGFDSKGQLRVKGTNPENTPEENQEEDARE